MYLSAISAKNIPQTRYSFVLDHCFSIMHRKLKPTLATSVWCFSSNKFAAYIHVLNIDDSTRLLLQTLHCFLSAASLSSTYKPVNCG